MGTQNKHNILHKISSLAEGDRDFEKELAKVYRNSFEELKIKFRPVVTQRNIKELSSISHKYRTTFLIFDLQEMASEVEKSKKMLESGLLDVAVLSRIVLNIETYCDELMTELTEEV